jgi:hypothetical protein
VEQAMAPYMVRKQAKKSAKKNEKGKKMLA